MPVFFGAHGTKNVSKQEKVERIYSIPLSGSGTGGIDTSEVGGVVASPIFTEQTSFDLDKVSESEHYFFLK
jgi:hypothetical protein